MQASKEQMNNISRLGPQAAFDVLRKSREKRWTAEGLVLQALPRFENKRKGPEPYGLCISCSKKTAKRAHDRNRIKRRLKAAACEVLPSQAVENMDYMVTGRFGTADRDFEQLKRDLIWCLKKLELLKG
ncbi:MAG: ribonuclease P protein component [Micavibrio aeruginosavorus]|uniref:Ribonuclease P protein component n=1 Tax=Micavibrio aeruginosavorus TaxID=349221 RepID=A0A2W5HPG8_9BACT|nr:MAG: ribonuclease P protein component [Micavibrio aeruginosavorus]